MPLTPGRSSRNPHLLGLGRDRVVTRTELIEAGVSGSTVSRRMAPDGPWQRLLPGVTLLHRGTPTGRERMVGALLYAGSGSLLTGCAALELYGVRTARELAAGAERPVHVLIPHGRRRQSHRFAVLERTRTLPEPRSVKGLQVAPPARALVDACRRHERLDDVRNLVSDALQNGGVTLDQLVEQVARAARQRTAPVRAAIDEMGTGVRFAAEARARQLIRERGFPEPLYNVQLLAEDGTVIVTPDGYYPQWGCGYQLDSRRWHLTAGDYERTVRIRTEAAMLGIMLNAVTPALVYQSPETFLGALSALIEANSHRVDVPQFRIRAVTPPLSA